MQGIACKLKAGGLPCRPAPEDAPLQRIDFARMRCPVARAMSILGERWTILILREAFAGTTRFDAFAQGA